VESSDRAAHAFLTYDVPYDLYRLLLWNFSAEAVSVDADPLDLPVNLAAKRCSLGATTPSNDENARLARSRT
jgi:hypothetical protein